ncbi:MAG TPA: phosphate ABC transporter permease subunit PstC [Acidimicrobiales bacterium]|nr:phosphate ABC transporter permease subunit PstC [Acidimicrobiales bacterium]
MTVIDAGPEVDLDDRPIAHRQADSAGDRFFRGLSTGAAMVSLAIVLLTLFFLFDRARPALSSSGYWRFLTSAVWGLDGKKYGVLGLLENTAIIALIALFIAVPFAIAMALFINEYAPARVRGPITSVIDLLASLPSLLYGVWGLFAFRTTQVKIAHWFNHNLSVLPFFRLSANQATVVGSSFEAGLVVSLMIVPIITSITRDVTSQVPRELCEGALALGGTRWGMIRDVVLPFGKNGIVGGILLGFGRALGETIAIVLIIGGVVFKANTHVLAKGTGSIAAWIDIDFGQAVGLERSALVACGLVLFLVTLLVNLIGRLIVSRTAQ